jgi:hypothetical protein
MVQNDLRALPADFPDAEWAPELARILGEIQELAGQQDRDAAQLTELEASLSQLIHDHKLKGLQGMVSYVTSLQPEAPTNYT